jgi:hypothetical protein
MANIYLDELKLFAFRKKKTDGIEKEEGETLFQQECDQTYFSHIS